MNAPISPFLRGHEFQIVSARIRSTKPIRLGKSFMDSTMGPFDYFGITTIALTDSDGISGEAPIHDMTVPFIKDLYLAKLPSKKPMAYEDVFASLYWNIRNVGFRGHAAPTLGGIDWALHDLAAKKAGKTFHHFMGATRDWTHVYATAGGTNFTIEEVIAEAIDLVRQGYTCLKMKVGKNFGRNILEDVERVKRVRAAVGENIRIAVDANQVWNSKTAIEFSRKVAAFNIAWFEEPVHSADLGEIREVCKHSPIPISMGESENSGKVFPTLVEFGVKHLQPVPDSLSSIAEWILVRDLANENGLLLSSGGYSFGVAQFIATSNETSMTEYLTSIVGCLSPYLSVQPEFKTGKFILPNVPGISMKVDWTKVEEEGLLGFDQTWNLK